MRKAIGMVGAKRREGERSEPERSEGPTIPETSDQAPAEVGRATADPEVTTRAVRRRFTAGYKRRILQEVDRCGPGKVAALLRREGLYSSHLANWRKQRETGELAGLEPQKRGKKPVERNPLAGEVRRLNREKDQLQKRLRQAETIIEVQKNGRGW